MATEISSEVNDTEVYLIVWLNSGQKMTVEFDNWADAQEAQDRITTAQAQVWDCLMERGLEHPPFFLVEPQTFDCLCGRITVQPGFVACVQVMSKEQNIQMVVSNQKQQDVAQAALQKSEIGFHRDT